MYAGEIVWVCIIPVRLRAVSVIAQRRAEPS